MSAGRVSTAAERARAPLGTAFTLALTLLAGSFLVLMPLVVMNTDPVDVGAGLPSHKQDAETLLYLVTFLVLLPFWCWAAPKLADRIQSGPNARALPAVTALLACLLTGLVALVRLSVDLPWNDGLKAVLVAGVVWAVIAGPSLLRMRSTTEWEPATKLVPLTARIWVAAGVLAVVAALTPLTFGHIDPPALILGLLVAAAVTTAYGRFRMRHLPRGWRIAADVVLVLLILVAIPDMVILPAERVGSDPNATFDLYVIQFHQNLWLGAASQVNGGSALLVDTVSQYGILPIYLIALFFKVAPIGGLSLGFFDASLSAGVFATGYLIIRMAGVRMGLAAAALAIGVFALVYGLTYPIGGLLQHGALRFGLPVLLVAFMVAAFRWPRISRLARLLALAVIGISSVWALEAFLYVSVTWIALALIQVIWQEPSRRWRWLFTEVLMVIAAWVITQIVFALITLLASGSLPEWGLYLSYLRDFLTGDVGDLTYDFTRWSRAFGVGAIYLASATGLWLIVTRSPDWSTRKKPALVALAGLTGYGIGLYSYYDNRSLDHVLPYVSLPALLLATVWLSLLLEREGAVSLAARRAGLAVACLFAALMVAIAWPAAGHRFNDSLLAYALPGGESLSGGFDRIANPPEFTPGAADGENLIDQYFAVQDEVPVLTAADLDNEILARADRPNALRITDAKEMGWVPGPHGDTLNEAVDSLQAGDLMIVDQNVFTAYPTVAPPGPDPAPSITGVGLEAVQIGMLDRIAERFRLQPVAGSDSGVSVVRLVPRKQP